MYGVSRVKQRPAFPLRKRRVSSMISGVLVNCVEKVMCCKGAVTEFSVTDSPNPDKFDRDEFAMMGCDVALSGVETSVEV